jgi:glutamate 5-kinase
MSASLAVVKIGSSSITLPSGELDDAALVKLAADLATARADGHRIVLVMSGAIAAGMPALGMTTRPRDMGTLQAIAAVGQPRLLERMNGLLGAHGVVVGQVLLTPYDFVHRSQYLHARATLSHLLDLRVLPIVNENDTVATTRSATGQRSAGGARVAPPERRRAPDAH